MTADTFNTLARCKALALAALVDAGGKPCWVASTAAAVAVDRRGRSSRPSARALPEGLSKGPRVKALGAAVAVDRCRRSPPPRKALPLVASAGGASVSSIDDGLSDREREQLRAFSPKGLAVIARALARLRDDANANVVHPGFADMDRRRALGVGEAG